MHRSTLLRISSLFALAFATATHAQVFTWTGLGETGSVVEGANWQGGVGPEGVGGEDVIFGDISQNGWSTVYVPTASLRNLILDGTARPYYWFEGASEGQYSTLMLTGNVTMTTGGEGGSSAYLSSYALSLLLPNASTTIDIDSRATLYVYSSISQGQVPAQLVKEGSGTLYLGGYNSHSGGTTVNGGTLGIDTSSALGYGALTMAGGTRLEVDYSTSVENDVELTSGEVVIYNDTSYPQVIGGNAFTTNITSTDYSYPTYVSIDGVISGDGKLIKDGRGTLALNNSNTYTGGTDINDGIVAISTSDALGTGTVAVNSGGTLEVNETSLNNTIELYGGATLSGAWGYINSAEIRAGSVLSPGSSESRIADLTFQDLTLAGGGILAIDIQYNGDGGFRHDEVHVISPDTLTITADNENPFTLRLTSLDYYGYEGQLEGTLIGESFQIYFLSFEGIEGNLVLGENFLLDLENFNVGSEALFDLAIIDNEFVLTITPVPEPSTYALMALGLGIIGVTVWRRRTKKA